MARLRVQLDHHGMRKLLTSAGVQRNLDEHAERAAGYARSIAPVASGAYRDSIHAEPAPTEKRARSRVVADDWKSHILEARDRVLGRSLDAAKE